MSGWDQAALVVALVAPLAAVVMAVALGLSIARWTEAGLLAGFVALAAVLVAGRTPSVAGLEPDPLALAVGAGAMVIALGLDGTQRAVGAVGAAAVAIGACAAVGSSTGAGPPLLGVAAAIAVTAPVTETVIALVAAGAVVVASVGGGALAVGLPVALIALGRRPGAAAVALPGLLLVGLRALPPEGLSSAGGVALVALGAIVAVGPHVVPNRDVRTLPGVPLGLLALGAAAGVVPDTQGAAVLLAAAAVLACVVDTPVGLLAALPGAVALAHPLLDAGGRTAAAVAVLTAVTGFAVARDRPRAVAPPAARALAGVLAIGLALRPSAWRLGATLDLGRYESGAAAAGAAALAAVVAGAAAGWVVMPGRAPDPPAPAPANTVRHRATVLGVTTALGLVAGALLQSSSL